jgi:hypothetical protein
MPTNASLSSMMSRFIITEFPPAADAAIDPKLTAMCDEIDKYRQQISPLMFRLNWLVFTVAGLSTGFLGSFLTVLGLGRITNRLRPLDSVILVTFIGTVTGILLNPRLFYIEVPSLNIWLFVVWQASVSAAIAWQFTKAPRST